MTRSPPLAMLTLLLLVAGCGQDPPPAARDREGQSVARSPAAPPPPPPADETETAEASAPPPAADPSSAEAAADVVRRYYALIGEGDYPAAHALWAGDASAMSVAAFAESFAKFARYRAEVGSPGRLDPGAGNVYVEVPVRVTGQLRRGGAFRMEGPVRLHRVNDVPGSTPEQRTWHIVASGVRPR